MPEIAFGTDGWRAVIAETFTFDKAHTLIGFRIRHILTKVEGRFKGFEGTIWIDRSNPSASKVDLTIQTASIDTGGCTAALVRPRSSTVTDGLE